MLWRAVLIWIVLTALLFLAFTLWIALGQYEQGQANPSVELIALYVFHSPLFWVLALLVFAGTYFVIDR